MRRGAVVEEDDAVGEGFGGEEFEADGAMARLDEGDAFADEAGNEGGNNKDFVPHPVDPSGAQKPGLRCFRLSLLSLPSPCGLG